MACVFLLLLIAPSITGRAEAALFSSPTVARIIYTADTLGYLHPCSTCGDNTQGGLARRAMLLRKLTAGQKHPLVIAGPNEFADDSRQGAELPLVAKIRALHGAFSRMPYTAVYVTPRMREAFQEAQLPALAKSVIVDEKPTVEYYRAGSLSAACIFFPPGASANGKPSREQLADISGAAETAAKSVSLVIGISPWGMHVENTLMDGPAFKQFHAIFGAGQGIAVPGQAMSAQGVPGPLWLRADRRGRAVNVLDIYEVPGNGTGARAAWLDGIHFSSRLVFLEKNLPEDEEVLKIIAAVPKD